MSGRTWTDAEDAVLRARFPHERSAVIAADIGRSVTAVSARGHKLGLRKSDAFLTGPESGRIRPASEVGAGYRFPPGCVPYNKGIKRGKGWAPGRMAEGQFKPGERRGMSNINWRPVGTVMTDSDGYLRLKVREPLPGERSGYGNPMVWRQLHRHIWEQAHGPIPARHHLRFKDGNKQHCDLDNLELVTQAEMMRRNSVHNLPEPLRKTIQVLGALNRQIRRRTEYAEQDHR